MVPVEWFFQTGLVRKKRSSVQSFVPDEVVSRSPIILTAAFRYDIDDRASVITKLRSIIITKDLDLGDGILVDRHAELIGSARLSSVQSVDRRYGRPATLPGNER